MLPPSSSISSSVDTRLADEEGVARLLAWAEAEGWNPGLADAHAFYRTDPQGYFLVCDQQHAVAGISMVRHHPEHAFLGLYLCLPEKRGRGFGMAAWNAALDYAGDSSIGLDGVPEQQANYRRSGFQYLHRTVRYAGVATAAHSDHIANVRDCKNDDINPVVQLDADIGGFRRESFFRHWLMGATTRKSYVYNDNGRIKGVITVRRCVEGFKVGPWLAENSAVAESLLSVACSVAAEQTLIVDLPEPNSTAFDLVNKLALKPVFETARMYRGTIPAIDTGRLYGVATLELG